MCAEMVVQTLNSVAEKRKVAYLSQMFRHHHPHCFGWVDQHAFCTDDTKKYLELMYLVE